MGNAILHTLLCCALFVASFCRAKHTTRDTLASVRVAICVQATAAIAGAAAPWVWAYRPEWPALMLLASMVLMQGVTSLLWRAGVPACFQRCGDA